MNDIKYTKNEELLFNWIADVKGDPFAELLDIMITGGGLEYSAYPPAKAGKFEPPAAKRKSGFFGFWGEDLED